MPPKKPPQRSGGFGLPEDFQGDATRAAFPRQLIVYEEKSNTWSSTTDVDILASIEYLAVSYRQTDFPNREEFEKDIRIVCQIHNLQAYWLDYACTGATQEEKNRDLYRIADVFRGAKTTLIMIRGNDDRPLSEGWMSWGDRIWTLPEALLSDVLIFKVGTRFIKNINLRRLANIAYRDREEEMMLIDGYSGKDPLPLHERVELLRRAIWKRSSGPDMKVSVQGARTNVGGVFTGYPAERVYALMGFMQYRIMPNPHDSEDEAFARLMEANRLKGHEFSWNIDVPMALSPEPQDDEVDNLATSISDTHLSPDLHTDSSADISEKGQFDPDVSSDPVADDLDTEIANRETAVRILADDNPDKVRYLYKLRYYLGKRFDKTGKRIDIDKAIEVENNIVRLTPDGHKDKPHYHFYLALSYMDRYEKYNMMEDLSQNIDHGKAAIRLISDKSSQKALYHSKLGISLGKRAFKTDNETDLDDAVASEREAVRLTPDDKMLRARYCYNLGLLLQRRFEKSKEVNDINEAIDRNLEAVSLVPDDNKFKSDCLSILGSSLQSRYRFTKIIDDLNEAVKSRREAIRIAPKNSKELAEYHSELGTSLGKLYRATHNMADLDEAIVHDEEAIRLAPNSHPDKPHYLRNVAFSYQDRYDKLKNINDLNKVIEYRLAGVDFIDDSDPKKPDELSTIGVALARRFDISKDIRDLDLAIKYEEETIRLTPDSSRHKAHSHKNIGITYRRHYDSFSDLYSLDKAILHRKAASRLIKDGHKDKPNYLVKLGQSSIKRYEKLHDVDDINTAVESFREAVKIIKEQKNSSVSDKKLYLLYLAEALESRFSQVGNANDKKEALAQRRERDALD